jgi:trehalose-6-phosphatase
VLAARGELDLWIERYRAFVDRLATARLRALVVDYDGTLCGPSERLTGPSSLLIKRLNTLLDAGCTVAVATGRGRSVRESLLQHITTAERRRRVIVGYHNGAEIGSLADDHCPPPSSPLASSLLPVAEALRASATIARYATVEAKGRQISLELKNSGSIDAIYEETTCAVRAHATCGKVVIVTSSHSVDVLAEGVGKRNVVDHVVRELELPGDGADCLLCIGDRGRHPGNDAELLAHSLALTVDEASHAPHTCWSLADPSVRFERACLEYLGRLRPSRKGLRFDVKGVSP